MSEQIYANAINEAVLAGNTAAEAWLTAHTKPAFNVVSGGQVVGQMLDACGFCWITVTDKRKKFYKWLVANKLATSYSMRLPFNSKYTMRQEMGLAEAMQRAAFTVLKSYDLAEGLRVESRID